MITQDFLKSALDYDPLTGIFKWKVSLSKRQVKGAQLKSRDTRGYYRTVINKRAYKAHRLAWIYVYGNISEDIFIDHINGKPGDNRIANLRLADYKQNARNRKKIRQDKSKYKGVTIAYGKFTARIFADGKRVVLGSFATEIEAAAAYDKKAKEIFKDFAVLNFPNEVK